MINVRRILVAALLSIAPVAHGEMAVKELTEVTGANVGFVSAKLSEHQAGVNGISAKRIDLIVEVERLALGGTLTVDRELAILKATGGTNLVKQFDALREFADEAALMPSRFDAVQAQARTDVAASYKPLSLSADKLADVAKTLASLAKPKSEGERAVFLISYLKEVRATVARLEKESKDSKDSAMGKSDGKAAGDVKKAEASQGDFNKALKTATAEK